MNVFSKMKKVGCIAIGLIAVLLSHTSMAATIVIKPNTIISQDRIYSNVTLDMSHGNFSIENNAKLTVDHSVINGTLSKDNPVLFVVTNGAIDLHDNKVDVKAVGIAPHPFTQSLQYVLQIGMASVNLKHNSFHVNEDFTVGLLVTTATIPTTGIKIVNNRFEHFHGVLYLITSDNALIDHNFFLRNSYGNIVNIGNNTKITNNSILFPGNVQLGNSMDIIDSSNITIKNNDLFTPTCHGIYVINSSDLFIDNNKITSGITYAINLLTNLDLSGDDAYIAKLIGNHKFKNLISSNITITNNFMSQNRYGLAANDVKGLIVKNNYFEQRFTSAAARKFWTDNSVLLTNVTNLTWEDNLYKEAFTQDNDGDNSLTTKFVTFPVTGGVTL
jgi:parallel beta-helix repeat protein